jgi:hypothetical protein
MGLTRAFRFWERDAAAGGNAAGASLPLFSFRIPISGRFQRAAAAGLPFLFHGSGGASEPFARLTAFDWNLERESVRDLFDLLVHRR